MGLHKITDKILMGSGVSKPEIIKPPHNSELIISRGSRIKSPMLSSMENPMVIAMEVLVSCSSSSAIDAEAENSSACMPIMRAWKSAITPLSRGNFRNFGRGLRGTFLTCISPSGERTATLQALSAFIITPSITACPP